MCNPQTPQVYLFRHRRRNLFVDCLNRPGFCWHTRISFLRGCQAGSATCPRLGLNASNFRCILSLHLVASAFSPSQLFADLILQLQIVADFVPDCIAVSCRSFVSASVDPRIHTLLLIRSVLENRASTLQQSVHCVSS